MRWWLLLGMVSVLSFTGLQPALAEEEPPTEDCAKLFRWFEGLRSYPSPGTKPWVRVYTGGWYRMGDDPPKQDPLMGFLLKDDGTTFQVLLLDLGTGTYERTPKDTPAHERVGFERLDPKAYVAEVLDPKEDDEDDDRAWDRFGERVTRSTELFLLAVAAHAHGLTKEAEALCDAARQAIVPRRKRSERTLAAVLAHDLAHAGTWRLTDGFGGGSFAMNDTSVEELVPRAELLKRFRDLAADFPKSPHEKRVAEAIRILDRMVKEDEARAAKPPKPWKDMTTGEQVADLIFQLRDQNGHQWSQPGWCDVFSDPRGDKSPAERLAAMRFAAVPQLIDALDDDRFTRSVGFHRDFYFSHHVLRVSEVAQAILSRIAGVNFWRPRTTSSTMRKDGKTETVKARAQAWWDEVQARGEEAVLADAVRAGGETAADQAHALIERFPEKAAGHVIAGLRASTDDWSRTALIGQLTNLPPTAEVLAALRAELGGDRSRGVRIAAAEALWYHDVRDGLAMALDLWASSNSEACAGFLMRTRTPEAAQALAHELGKRPLRTRYMVVDGIAEPGTPDDDTPWLEAVETLLVGRLDDLERMVGYSATRNNVSYSDPRIGDLAALHLSLRFPKRYAFDIEASEGVRDRQRVEAKNVWRKGRGLDPLPLPAMRTVKRTPPEELAPVLAAATGEHVPARKNAEASLRALGLAAAPGLLAHARGLDEKHPRRAALLALARAIAATVVSVEVTGPRPPKGSALGKAIAALESASLSGGHVVDVMRAAAAQLPEGSHGLTFEATREPDLTGVVLRLRFEPGPPPTEPHGGGWRTARRIAVGKLGIEGSYGSSALTYLRDESAWSETRKHVDRAVSMPPDRSLVVRLVMTRTTKKD